ncbi:dephospho-CoA kinase [Celerinatantimonas yamalensis]|uniref:Dephospho-CoA kinase n=1 Tax=Celerinatantimonas yamalensis TaxID=559956 RepID=A0ABW9G5B4_9GAMM
MIVALTGGIASGKTTVANWIASRGIDCIDADLIAHQLVAPGTVGLLDIAEHFGPHVLDKHGALNRRLLRNLVFNNANERQWLEHYLHPKIRARMRQQISESRSTYTLLVIPLLVENNLQQMADRVLVVDIEPHRQLTRICQRDQVSLQQARQIVANQASREQRLNIADDVIVNDGSLQELLEKTAHQHQQYLQLAARLNSILK